MLRRLVSKTRRHATLLGLSTLLVSCSRGSDFSVSGPRPVDDAARKLALVYGWVITYEDLPVVFSRDLEDVTSKVRRDGKSASEPGVHQILVARGGSFSFSFDPPTPLRETTRELARAAILDMLKSYARSVGGVEMFRLTESPGFFHIVPARRRAASGEIEEIVPLLDTPVNIAPRQRDGVELVREICQELRSRTGVQVSGPGPGGANLLHRTKTEISSFPNESARSILSRFLAEIPVKPPITWHLLYQGGEYGLNLVGNVSR